MITTREKLNMFFRRIHLYFSPIKTYILKPKNCTFSQLIIQSRNYKVTLSVIIWRLWRIKYVTLCGDKKFQLEEQNAVIIFQKTIMFPTCDVFCWTYSCKNSSGLSFHRIPAANAANDCDRDGYRTFIVQLPYEKMKTFCWFDSYRKKLLLTRP